LNLIRSLLWHPTVPTGREIYVLISIILFLTCCFGRYDLLHNAHLNLEGLDELFKVAQVTDHFHFIVDIIANVHNFAVMELSDTGLVWQSFLLFSKDAKSLTNNSKHKIFTKHPKLLSSLCHITTKKQKTPSKKHWQTNPLSFTYKYGKKAMVAGLITLLYIYLQFYNFCFQGLCITVLKKNCPHVPNKNLNNSKV
jgi:hypothetical protein